MKPNRLFLLLFGICIEGISFLSYAATPLNQTTIKQIDPGLVTKQLQPRLKEQQIQANIHSSQQTSETTPFVGASEVTFILKEVVIRGNQAFTTEELMRFFKPYLNKHITLAKVIDLRNQITHFYRSNGYIFSKAILPPQTINNGLLQIEIIEGYVDTVSVEGDAPPRIRKQIQTFTNDIAIQRPAQSETMIRSLLLVNDIPGVSAQGAIKASPTKQHASELKLITEYQPVQASLAYDNFGSRYFGPQELSLTASLNSLLFSGGSLRTLALASANPKELQYVNAEYEQYLGNNGLKWTLGSAYSDTHPGFNLTSLEIHGISKNYFTNLAYPFIRSQNQNLTGRLELNYLDSISTSFGEYMYFDRVRSLTLGAHYNNVVAQGENVADLKFTRGFNILSAENGGNLRSRAQGISDFNKANLLLSREQMLVGNFSVYGMFQGQYTNSPLLAAEEFSFGGANLGRGFEQADLSGDRGVAGTIEFRLNQANKFINATQYYAFCDSGTVWNLDRDAEKKQFSATSAGLGVRLGLFSHFLGNVFVAKPISHQNSTLEALHHNSKAASVYFQLMTYF